MKNLLLLLLLFTPAMLMAQEQNDDVITDIVTGIVTSVEDVEKDEVVIYPNPSNGVFTVNGLESYSIVDARGKNATMPLTNGIYFVLSEKRRYKVIVR